MQVMKFMCHFYLQMNLLNIRKEGKLVAPLRENKGSEEVVPAEVAFALIRGENPIRVWREYRKLTQQKLAATAGISNPYLSQVEKGKRKTSVRVIQALARALKVDVGSLITG